MNFKKLFGRQDNSNAAEIQSGGSQIAKIKVDHGYEPETVTLKKGVPAKLVFHRINESDCLSRVQSKKLAFNQALPLNQDVEISVDTNRSGEFDYACGMNMFHGKVVVQ